MLGASVCEAAAVPGCKNMAAKRVKKVSYDSTTGALGRNRRDCPKFLTEEQFPCAAAVKGGAVPRAECKQKSDSAAPKQSKHRDVSTLIICGLCP